MTPQKRYQVKAKKLGLCTDCGRNKEEERREFVRCQKCADKQHNRPSKSLVRRFISSMCPTCKEKVKELIEFWEIK